METNAKMHCVQSNQDSKFFCQSKNKSLDPINEKQNQRQNNHEKTQKQYYLPDHSSFDPIRHYII